MNERTEFKRGDLVRFADDPNESHVHFARVFRVHQSWLEFKPGVYGARKVDCQLISRRKADCG